MHKRINLIMSGLLQIAEGVVIVLTLGFVCPQWAYGFLKVQEGNCEDE
jgi:hypothetical protein